MIHVSEGVTLANRQVKERFVRASGPGAKNQNKDATKVELRFDVWASSLSPDVKDRLTTLAGRSVTSDGVLVVVSRIHRSQAQNRKDARARLVALLRRAARPPNERRPTWLANAARETRLASKRLRSTVKQSRRPRRPGEDAS